VSDLKAVSEAPKGEGFGSWEQAVRWLRDQPDQQALVKAAYYDDPLARSAERYWRSEEWCDIRARLPKVQGAALDVGAGRGIASFALAKEGFRVTALEPDNSALVGAQAIRALAAETGLPIKVTQEYSERLPFADGSFDLVFARAVLHHTTNLDAACMEFNRVLKPGGLFFAVREHVLSKEEDLPRFLELHPLHKLYGGENAFVLNRYLSALESAGFELRQCLAPLQSAINFAPHTARTLRSEIAQRLGGSLLSGPARFVMDVPGVWRALLPLLTRMDHRPGRLYSFVCTKRG
jgi:SAM-dependent methyltransferase